MDRVPVVVGYDLARREALYRFLNGETELAD